MTAKQSKFKDVFDTRRDMPAESDPDTETAAPNDRPTPGKPGRPENGKRSNPAYAQVSAWIRKDTHRQAKIKMLQNGDDRDFSDLVQDLLESWIAEP